MTSGVPWQVTRASSRARQAARDAARAARAAKSTALADQLLALESRIGAAKLSVMPDPGGRSDLIAQPSSQRAIRVGAEGILLVQNRRRNGSHDWTPPGGVVEVASGQRLDEFFADRIFGPLGMTDTAFWAGPAAQPRR